jgi:hemoglobin
MTSMLLALFLLQPAATADLPAAAPHAMPGEEAVDPYVPDPANLGARPFTGDGMARAFGGQDGIRRIVDRFVAANFADPMIGEIFMNNDPVRLRRTIFEQFCAILNAGCSYSGRDMATSHKDMGIRRDDMNRLVENLQRAMTEEGVNFQAQNRFLSKLAPMNREVMHRQ